jgi:cysteinyl-tRNA synthetase
MDLKFPHHECEIAQNVAATGQTKPVHYWLHGNMLTLNGKKMSKSDGNFILPGDLLSGQHALLDKAYSPMVIRFFFLQAHYGSTLDMSIPALDAAEKGFRKLAQAVELMPGLKAGNSDSWDVLNWENACYKAMNDDFNSPVLLAHLFEGASMAQKLQSGTESLTSASLEKFMTTFNGFFFDVLGLQSEVQTQGDKMDSLMQLILEMRKEARERKDWSTSDLIRDRLADAGISIKDGKEGSTWEIK